MSHFYVIAILPKDRYDVESRIAELMDRYDEGKEVEPYKRTCSCIKNKQYKMKTQLVEKEVGMTWDEARKKLKKLGDGKKWNWERNDKEWQKLTKPLRDADCKYNSNDFKAAPDKKCEQCKGTGLYETTYNPDSKWDWYVIGGRWNGEITGKPRSDEKGFNFGDEFHQVDENTVSVKQLIKRKEIPFAVLTPDGTWNEKGQMGWFGCASNEKCSNKWEDIVMSIYKKYSDHIGVGLDCHI